MDVADLLTPEGLQHWIDKAKSGTMTPESKATWVGILDHMDKAATALEDLDPEDRVRSQHMIDRLRLLHTNLALIIDAAPERQ